MNKEKRGYVLCGYGCMRGHYDLVKLGKLFKEASVESSNSKKIRTGIASLLSQLQTEGYFCAYLPCKFCVFGVWKEKMEELGVFREGGRNE